MCVVTSVIRYKLSYKCYITTTDCQIHIHCGETNGDRVFVRNPAKGGELACKCTTASTDCHIQIQPTSPYTYNVSCPNIIYNHHMLPSHGTTSMTPLPPPCTTRTVQVQSAHACRNANATRNKTTSAAAYFNMSTTLY